MNTSTVVLGLVLAAIGLLFTWLWLAWLNGLLVLIGLMVIVIGLVQSRPKNVIIQTSNGAVAARWPRQIDRPSFAAIVFSTLALVLVALSISMTWYSVETTYGSGIEFSPRHMVQVYFIEYSSDLGESVGGLMEQTRVAMAAWIVLGLLLNVLCLGGSRIMGSALGWVLATTGILAALIFALRIDDAINSSTFPESLPSIDGFVGSGQSDRFGDIAYGPSDGWRVIVVAGGFQILAALSLSVSAFPVLKKYFLRLRT